MKIAMNTDAQDLKRSLATKRFQLGSQLTKGLGAGANPEVGREAALEDRDRIAELIVGADMVTNGAMGDIQQALGYRWTAEGTETLFLRSKVLVDARAAGIEEVGQPFRIEIARHRLPGRDFLAACRRRGA
jgi:hypothetical protein